MINIRIFVLGWMMTLAACQPAPEENNEKEEQKTEHSEKDTTRVDIADIESGIRNHIREKTKAGNGYFHVEHKGEELQLKLVRVHTEYIANLGPQRHFVCVDLAEESGDVYDVDFFMKGKAGNMQVTQTTVHKLNGRPFYTWQQHKDGTWHRVPVEDASNELMGVIEGADTFEFYYKAKLPEITKKAKMWIPIAQSDSFQTINIKSLDVPGKQQMLKDREYGNKILYLKLKPEHSGQTINIVYQVQRKEKEPYKAKKPLQADIPSPEKYLASTELLPVGGRFGKIAHEVIQEKQRDNKLMQARALYDHIIDSVEYQKAGKYGTGDANYACDKGSGNCTEFHSYFISLARSAGIPARFSIGAAIPSARDNGGVNGYHCWAEFYAEGKWWPVDISEGNKYSTLATYYFGHHPANRIMLSQGRNLHVEPGPKSGPVHFLAYPVLEVDGKRISVETTFSFKRKTAS